MPNRLVNVRVAEGEREAWKAAARAAGLTLSEWIRSRLNAPEEPPAVYTVKAPASPEDQERMRAALAVWQQSGPVLVLPTNEPCISPPASETPPAYISTAGDIHPGGPIP